MLVVQLDLIGSPHAIPLPIELVVVVHPRLLDVLPRLLWKGRELPSMSPILSATLMASSQVCGFTFCTSSYNVRNPWSLVFDEYAIAIMSPGDTSELPFPLSQHPAFIHDTEMFIQWYEVMMQLPFELRPRHEHKHAFSRHVPILCSSIQKMRGHHHPQVGST